MAKEIKSKRWEKKCGECRWNESTSEKMKKSQVFVPQTEPKKKRKTKVKVEIKSEIKPPKLPKRQKVKTRKQKRKNEINIDEVV